MTLTEARNNKRGFAGLRTKRAEIPVGTPWNCLHSSATNANFFTIRAQGLRSTYPNQLALQCETQFSFDRTGKFHTTIATHLKLHARKRGSNMAMERGKQRMSKKCLSTKDVSSTILHCDRLESTTASLPFSPPCFHRNHHHQGYPMHPARALGFHQVQPGL